MPPKKTTKTPAEKFEPMNLSTDKSNLTAQEIIDLLEPLPENPEEDDEINTQRVEQAKKRIYIDFTKGREGNNNVIFYTPFLIDANEKLRYLTIPFKKVVIHRIKEASERKYGLTINCSMSKAGDYGKAKELVCDYLYTHLQNALDRGFIRASNKKITMPIQYVISETNKENPGEPLEDPTIRMKFKIKDGQLDHKILNVEAVYRTKEGNAACKDLTVDGAPITPDNIHEKFTYGSEVTGKNRIGLCISQQGVNIMSTLDKTILVKSIKNEEGSLDNYFDADEIEGLIADTEKLKVEKNDKDIIDDEELGEAIDDLI